MGSWRSELVVGCVWVGSKNQPQDWAMLVQGLFLVCWLVLRNNQQPTEAEVLVRGGILPPLANYLLRLSLRTKDSVVGSAEPTPATQKRLWRFVPTRRQVLKIIRQSSSPLVSDSSKNQLLNQLKAPTLKDVFSLGSHLSIETQNLPLGAKDSESPPTPFLASLPSTPSSLYPYASTRQVNTWARVDPTGY